MCQTACSQGYYCPHRHIVFTIPEELRNWFRQDRTRLNLLLVAARNTICILINRSLLKKLKTKQLRNTHYIFKDIPVRNEFGMIATIHTLSCTGTCIFAKNKRT